LSGRTGQKSVANGKSNCLRRRMSGHPGWAVAFAGH